MSDAPAHSPSALERYFPVALGVLLAVGFVARVELTLHTRGVVYDLDSLKLVGLLLHGHPGVVYQVANSVPNYPRWPYPPGLFPIVWLCRVIADHTGSLGFERVIRFPTDLADIGLAYVVQWYLGRRGVGHVRRLCSAALIALGPSFGAISAIHGQIDADGILFAVLAVAVWELRIGRRALIAGVLIGIGALVKSVPGLALLALLPTVDDREEAGWLIGAAAATFGLGIAPWVIHDGLHWFHNLNYNGGIGLGGIGLLAQPSLALNWIHVGSTPISAFSLHLLHASRWIAAVSVLGCFAVLVRARPPAPLAAAALYLTIYAFGVTFFMQYMVWALPFLLMAGYTWQVLALQALLLAPVYVIYHGVLSKTAGNVFYVGPMIAVWACCTLGLGLLLRRALRDRRTTPVATAI